MRRSGWLLTVTLCSLLVAPVYAGGTASALRMLLLGRVAQPGGAPAAAVRLDSASRGCMTCHDGSAGPLVVAGGGPMRFRGPRSVDHPVGMEYRDFALGDPAHYRAASALDASLRLVDGKVGCLTCHRLRRGSLIAVGAAVDSRPCGASAELANDSGAGGLCVACHLQ